MIKLKIRNINLVCLIILLVLYSLIISCKKEKELIEEAKTFGGLNGLIQNEFNQPIDNATVKIGVLATKSDINGNYSFSKLPTNECEVLVIKESYLTKSQNVIITKNNISKLDFFLSAGKSYLSLPDSIFNVLIQNGVLEIPIQSNVSWTVTSTSSWIKCQTDRGEGSEKLTINYLENNGLTDRADTIIITSGFIHRKIIINQSAPIKLLAAKGIIGNGEKNIVDSVSLIFNKPVTIKSITANNNYNSYCEIKTQRTNNGSGYSFSYACAKLGGEYSFLINAVDAGGNIFSQNVDIRFYKSKLNLPGIITDYLLINDETEVLISTNFPGQLIRYSILQDKIIETFDLSNIILPLSLCFNPYNSKVYIIGAYTSTNNTCCYQYSPDIYTYEMNSGKIIKVATVKPGEFDHPGYPTILPYKLGFTKSGHGIVCLRAQSSNSLRWRLIDSQLNDSIYNYPYYTDAFNEYNTSFDNVCLNFDQTKLYLIQSYGSCNYGIFDGNTEHVSILRPTSVTRSAYITPYRKSDKFFAGQLYDQFIIDLNGNLSQISKMKLESSSSDFSYRKNEENIIYYCGVSYFQILDYNSAKTLMWCESLHEFMKFTSTINGENAIAYLNNSDQTSSLYVFDTDSFYNNIKN